MPQLLRVSTLLAGFAPAIVRVGSGYSPSLDALLTEAALNGLMLDFAQGQYWRAGVQSATAAAVSGWTYTRSGTRFAGDNALTSFGANTPRIVAGSGIRVTAGATNLALWSADLTNATWSKVGCTITADNLTAPDGTLTMDTLVEDTSTGFHHVTQTFTVGAASTNTVSGFARAGTRNWLVITTTDGANIFRSYFNLSTGVTGTVNASHTARITNVGSGVYRWSITYTMALGTSLIVATGIADADNSSFYVGTGGTMGFWGAQLETGSTATDYIPTTTASATAGADAASVTVSGFNYPLSVISMFSTAVSTGARRGVASVWNTGSFQASSHAIGLTNLAEWSSGGSPDAGASISAASITLGAVQRVAGRMVLNDVRGALNGTLSAQDVTASVPTTPNQLAIGSNSGIGHNPLEGWVGLLAILPRALTDTELTNGTA